jgi:hypothetical protein
MAMTPDVDERSVTLIRDPIVHFHIYPVQSLSRCKSAGPIGRVHMVSCSDRRRYVGALRASAV